jgi:hypothetical protein
MALRRPYGTPNEFMKSLFPTLKRGANKLCASSAFENIRELKPGGWFDPYPFKIAYVIINRLVIITGSCYPFTIDQ